MKLQRIPDSRYTYTCHFDFEIGYLMESPCRSCEHSEDLPGCANACRVLDRVRGILADVVPCTRRF